MSKDISFGCTQSFGSATYSVSGMSSPFAARLNVYQRAYRDGEYSPPMLREKWWQFWRPTEHSEIDKALMGLPYTAEEPRQ
ncbi:hypothetical protein [Ensifer adhaerens]|uniref:hypothetical protein n=1 Tax=Ensifer adhaerens TaxID=106592 RepID=UPI00098F31AC|nr:hypothetical protein [Ensifer adhaerens]